MIQATAIAFQNGIFALFGDSQIDQWINKIRYIYAILQKCDIDVVIQ